jgi:hypothetical protein
MPVARDERNRILSMLAAGQITTPQAEQLLDVIEVEPTAPIIAQKNTRERVIRLRTTSLSSTDHKTNFTASMPMTLLKTSLRLGGVLLPHLQVTTIHSILRTIESSRSGLVLDLQDLEHGERLEIFID